MDGKENVGKMVIEVGRGLEEGPLPISVWDVDPTLEEMIEAMKYIIDSGWMNNQPIYLRKAEYKENGEIKPAVIFTHEEDDFVNFEKNGYYHILDEYPIIVGDAKSIPVVNDDGFIDYVYDGKVFIRLDNQNVTFDAWKLMQIKKTLK